MRVLQKENAASLTSMSLALAGTLSSARCGSNPTHRCELMATQREFRRSKKDMGAEGGGMEDGNEGRKGTGGTKGRFPRFACVAQDHFEKFARVVREDRRRDFRFQHTSLLVGQFPRAENLLLGNPYGSFRLANADNDPCVESYGRKSDHSKRTKVSIHFVGCSQVVLAALLVVERPFRHVPRREIQDSQ